MATKKKTTTKTMSYSDYDGNSATSSGYSKGENQPMTRSKSSNTSGVKTDSSGNLIPGQSLYEGGAPVPGLKINSAGQPTDSYGNVSQDRLGPANLPGTGSATGTVTPVAPVTTSDQATAAVDNLNNKIEKGLVNPPTLPQVDNPMGQYNPAYNPGTDPAVAKEIAEGNKIYADRRKELQKERDQAIAELKTSLSADRQELAQTQKKDMAVNSRNLAYLQQGGQSASAQAYLSELEMAHGREQANLTAKYNSAILQARTAFSEKDFALADKMVQNASDIKKFAYQRNQDYLDNSLKIQNFIMEQKKFEFTKEQAMFERQTEAKQFAIDNGIEQQFYDVGGVVYETSSGRAFSTAEEFIAAGGDPKFQNVYVIKPGSKEAKAFVYDLATKYIDAGINPLEDDPATAQAKIKSNSAIYREQVRPPSSGGGGGGSGGLTAADYNLMLKMAPAAVPQLAKTGMGWAAIAEHFVSKGIDPGSPDIDDALHRQFDTQEQYRKYQQQTKYKQPVVDNNYNGIPDNEE